MGRLLKTLIKFAPVIYPIVRKYMKKRKQKKVVSGVGRKATY